MEITSGAWEGGCVCLVALYDMHRNQSMLRVLHVVVFGGGGGGGGGEEAALETCKLTYMYVHVCVEVEVGETTTTFPHPLIVLLYI